VHKNAISNPYIHSFFFRAQQKLSFIAKDGPKRNTYTKAAYKNAPTCQKILVNSTSISIFRADVMQYQQAQFPDLHYVHEM
jgi:hypothetical protein